MKKDHKIHVLSTPYRRGETTLADLLRGAKIPWDMFCPYDGRILTLREERQTRTKYECTKCFKDFVIIDNEFKENIPDSYGQVPWDKE